MLSNEMRSSFLLPLHWTPTDKATRVSLNPKKLDLGVHKFTCFPPCWVMHIEIVNWGTSSWKAKESLIFLRPSKSS